MDVSNAKTRESQVQLGALGLLDEVFGTCDIPGYRGHRPAGVAEDQSVSIMHHNEPAASMSDRCRRIQVEGGRREQN